ncbi:hypothetical protein [Actinacidiphila epipremni]|uniref:Uncharacterized protein n=1 Tax=Actinacidiphila epipremni TaxID=2053013 RepID=A0ABX0ZLH7_9ACTN|nr:hypothetical protein [Actinacidiphila epipremni]NJP43890.1 hypothetical protein [Actinacidiphila epipremni]
MNNKRILAGIALTAGIGLAGVATAPASTAAAPQSATVAAGHRAGQQLSICVVSVMEPVGKGEKVTSQVLPRRPAAPGKVAGPGQGVLLWAKAAKPPHDVKLYLHKIYTIGPGPFRGARGCPPLPKLPKGATGIVTSAPWFLAKDLPAWRR